MLGFLSNFRDVKSTLSSGMLLLLACWLAFGHQISQIDGDDTLTGNIAKLVSYMGPVATLAAVTFFAYVLGLVLALDTAVLGAIHKVPVSGPTFRISEGKRLRRHVEQVVTKAIAVRHPHLLRNDLGLLGTELRRVEPGPEPEDRGGVLVQGSTYAAIRPEESAAMEDFQGERTRLISGIMRRIYLDIEILAVQLGRSNEKAYERFDKGRGEAEFRAGLVIPLLVVGVVCVWRLSLEGYPWWWCVGAGAGGLTAAYLLARRAASSARKSREEVHIGILHGDVEVTELTILASQKERVKIPGAAIEGSLEPGSR